MEQKVPNLTGKCVFAYMCKIILVKSSEQVLVITDTGLCSDCFTLTYS